MCVIYLQYECNELQEALDILDMVQNDNIPNPGFLLEESVNIADVDCDLPLMVRAALPWKPGNLPGGQSLMSS